MSKIILTSQTELEDILQSCIRKALNEQRVESPVEDNQFLNLKEASKLLNLASQTIYGLTSKRMIPYLKRGKKLYFKKSDLIKWLEEGRKKSFQDLKSISSSILKQDLK